MDPDILLMTEFQRGDREAFAKLVRKYRRNIIQLAYRYLHDRVLAEDIAQEVFLRVFKARSRYRPGTKFSSWLFRIAVNLCINESRSKKRAKVVSYDASSSPEGGEYRKSFADEAMEAPGETMERKELAEKIRDILDILPENQRTAIILNKYEGFSYNEIADTMELSLQAVKSLLSRARSNIKDKLMPYLRSGRGGRR